MDRRNQTNDLATPRTASISSTPPASVGAGVRRSRMPTDGGGPGAESRAELARWLTAGRLARGLTREHVARVTRIQLRTIERLEEARFDELPADVFVRGFIRNYAMCVGLSVDDALARYAACGFAAAPVASAQAQALIETMASLAPVAARTASVVVVPSVPKVLVEEPVVIAPVVAPAPIPVVTASSIEAASSSGPGKKPGPERDSKGRFVRKGTVSQQHAAVDVDALGLAPWAEATAFDELEVEITVVESAAVEVCPPAFATGTQTIRTLVSAPALTPTQIPTLTIPTLSIDDDDPESAEREREDRATQARDKDGGWRSFLPPALLDQDRGRQGGLTLAVIILLIVATLTLSYLMRRPSSTGEGITSIPSATLLG